MRAAVLGLLLVLSACAFDLVGARPGSLEFDARELRHGQWFEEPEVEARGEAGRIVVNGRLSAGSPCHVLSGELERSGSELKLVVRVQSVGEACVASIGSFEYEAAIGSLASGSYRLRVIHTYSGSGWPTVTALEQTVRVQ